MQKSIEILLALSFLITGLSHLLQPKVWVLFFIEVRERGAVGGFINAFIHIPMGLLVVAFHNTWTFPELVVTILGWGLMLKGTLYFVFPQLAVKSLARISLARAWEFQVAGAAAVALAAAIFWVAFLAA